MEEKKEIIYEVPKEVFDHVERIRLTVEGEEEGRYLYIEELLHPKEEEVVEDEALLERVEQLERAIEAQEVASEKEESRSNERIEELMRTMFQTINMLDQIATSYAQEKEHQLVAEQLRKVADMTVHQLRSFDVEEIPLYGQPLDGQYMQSFGPAPIEVDPELEPHTVAIIQQRAFRHTETGEILQDAIVYTTPEAGDDV